MLSRHKKYLEEGEPPPKKLHTEADDFIKKLSEKQLNTSTSLQKELSYNKEFCGSEELRCFSKLNGQIYTLPEFENNLLDLDSVTDLKSKGLSDEDIKLFKTYQLGSEYLKSEYKNVNIHVLNERIGAILKLLENKNQTERIACIGSKHQQEYLNSVKPNSTEIKLLEFALKNQRNERNLSHPMDELPELEKQLMNEIDVFSPSTLKKIQKKARNLNMKIETLTKEKSVLEEPKDKLKSGGFVKKSLWDCKEMPKFEPQQPKLKTEKVYTCKNKKPNLYTIKNGYIVKLNTSGTDQQSNEKLTVEEIRKLPRFENYEPGKKCHKLFLKNLAKNISEENLRTMLVEVCDDIKSIKIMSGKMKGQAFIEFISEDVAEIALNLLNGTVFNTKPIIVQYANKKDKT